MHGVCLEITLTNYLFSLRLRPASSGNTDTMKAPRVLMPRWRHALKLYHMKLTLAYLLRMLALVAMYKKWEMIDRDGC